MVEHTLECMERQAGMKKRHEEFEKKYPNYCRKCGATGESLTGENGVWLNQTCKGCLCAKPSKCPLCGEPLSESDLGELKHVSGCGWVKGLGPVLPPEFRLGCACMAIECFIGVPKDWTWLELKVHEHNPLPKCPVCKKQDLMMLSLGSRHLSVVGYCSGCRKYFAPYAHCSWCGVAYEATQDHTCFGRLDFKIRQYPLPVPLVLQGPIKIDGVLEIFPPQNSSVLSVASPGDHCDKCGNDYGRGQGHICLGGHMIAGKKETS